MRHPWLVALFLIACAASLQAADPKAEEAVVALAGSRAKAELALREARQAADENRSGWNTAWQTLDLTRNKINWTLQRRVQAEERKDDGNRDHDLMALLRQRLDKLYETWETFNVKERTPLLLSYRDAAETVQRLNQVLDSLGNAERAWKEANLEPATLQAVFDAVAQRLTGARQQAEKALAGMQEKQKMWDVELEAATKLVEAGGRKP